MVLVVFYMTEQYAVTFYQKQNYVMVFKLIFVLTNPLKICSRPHIYIKLKKGFFSKCK